MTTAKKILFLVMVVLIIIGFFQFAATPKLLDIILGAAALISGIAGIVCVKKYLK